LSVLSELKISSLIYSGLNFSDLVLSIPEISNPMFSFFITATVINCYLLLLLWNKTLNTFNSYIIPSKELILEKTVFKFQARSGFFGPNENSNNPKEFPHNSKYIPDSKPLSDIKTLQDSKSFTDIKPFQDSKPLTDINSNTVGLIPQETVNNKNWFIDFFNIKLNNIYFTENMKEWYNNLGKKDIFKLTEEKKEILIHKRTLIYQGAKFKIDFYTGLINGISETIIRNIKILSEHWIYYFPFFKGINISLDLLPFNSLSGNFFILSLICAVPMRIWNNQVAFTKIDLVRLSSLGISWGFRTYILLSPIALYNWYLWLTTVFIALLAQVAMNKYSISIAKYIDANFGNKIREFWNQNIFITKDPKFIKLKRLPLYKFKFQLICLKNNIINHIIVSVRNNPPLTSQIDNILGELSFYVRQRKLFEDIINRINNKEEFFYDDASAILFTQYIEVIDHLIDELEARKENLILILREENEKKRKDDDERRGRDYYDDFYG